MTEVKPRLRLPVYELNCFIGKFFCTYKNYKIDSLDDYT